MIRVDVTLEPWWGTEADDKRIAQMTIYNDGTLSDGSGDSGRGSYVTMSHNMNTMAAKRTGTVENYRRDQDVLHLIAKALKDMGYGE